MKNTARLIVPVLLLLAGIYALFTAFGSSGEDVALFGNHQVPRGLVFMFAGIGIGGGVLILSTMFSKNKSAASGESSVNHG